MQPSGASPSSKRYENVRVWASLLAGESRGERWVRGSYAVPETVVRIARELDTIRNGGLICLIGSQGVGKSSALMALDQGAVPGTSRKPDTILLKWRRELHTSFLENTRKTSHAYICRYSLKLIYKLLSKLKDRKQHHSVLDPDPAKALSITVDTHMLQRFEKDVEKFQADGVLYSSCPDMAWAESKMDKSTVQRLRQDTCLEILLEKSVILIDTPDYSKTDRRRMEKDLDSIHWLWNKIASSGGPTIVFAVQKEMSEGHFFLDKALKFELEPLAPERMVEVYVRRFQSTEPFTEQALLKLAQMSRGIFRRFLRYILLTLDLWEYKPNQTEMIDVDLVVQAVPVERLAEDMELELFALFPKHSDLRSLAVRLIMLLEERGERKQSELQNLLEVKDYALSRLLVKLETAHYITRRREGNDKIVSLHHQKRLRTGPAI